jgi:hypothetical protein
VWDSAPLEASLLKEADRLVGDQPAFLLIDETALPKKGHHSVGVGPQYASSLGKTSNCQSLVSVTLLSFQLTPRYRGRVNLRRDAAHEVAAGGAADQQDRSSGVQDEPADELQRRELDVQPAGNASP